MYMKQNKKNSLEEHAVGFPDSCNNEVVLDGDLPAPNKPLAQVADELEAAQVPQLDAAVPAAYQEKLVVGNTRYRPAMPNQNRLKLKAMQIPNSDLRIRACRYQRRFIRPVAAIAAVQMVFVVFTSWASKSAALIVAANSRAWISVITHT
ncbi:hypothetical protein AYI69_g7625 [Smittium culicis]|uniref:Uncharacterized protein n=1 Tax=Smittium culicis TaxID=133412 RepID=A0A1R1XQQ3_9FUNG|nr:hypothetical protein AYI69_g7625 [Smittium culicis]